MRRITERLLSSIFPRFEPAATLRPSAQPPRTRAGVQIRWLGTAGFVISSERANIVIDPYLTRAGFDDLCAPLIPDEAELRRRLPSCVDAIVCGHSHFDHLLDAPLAARMTGAKFVGSRSSVAFARASGVTNERIVEVAGATRLVLEHAEVRLFPSLHARIALGRVPFAGEVRSPVVLPAPMWRYRVGGAYGVLVETGGVRVYHNGSADLVDAELEGVRADVVLVGLAGRQVTPNYLERLLRLLAPRVVIPAHHDSMFTPLDAGVRLLPGVDFAGFLRDVACLAPKARVIAPRYDESVWVGESADEAFIVH
ncbi:MAG: MBL fold metallo-hydrolase [Myxococcota bacterium]